MTKPLRLGVIGLGRRWRQRYQPAMRALSEWLAVGGVCDQVFSRAEREARRLGCKAATGPTALLEREDIEAVLLSGGQWYGLWPVEIACRLGKPVFCAGALDGDDTYADHLVGLVQQSRLPVMLEMTPQVAPATGLLRELLAGQLGPAQVLVCDIMQRSHERETRATPPLRPVTLSLLGPRGIAVLDWCVGLLGGEPRSIQAVGPQTADFVSLFLEFDGGRAVQINRRQARGVCSSIHLQVNAANGSALVQLPNHVRWTDAAGSHAVRLRAERPGSLVLLEGFFRAVREGQPSEPGLSAVLRALRWLRAARISFREKRPVSLPA